MATYIRKKATGGQVRAEGVGIQPSHSPLFMITNDPVIHQLISLLAAGKREQEEAPGRPIRIELSRSLIASVKETFRLRILRGELNLHLASNVLASHFLGHDCELHSNVIGMLPGAESRPFLIRERITSEILFSQTDLDLGNLMVGKFRYQASEGWAPLSLAANFVEYIPPRDVGTGVNRITSRVKAEEEVWNKVTDELFSVDELLLRDKHLHQFSKFIKDVFGIKIVCENEKACMRVHEHLRGLTAGECDWSVLKRFDIPAFDPVRGGSDRPLLEFIETKNYLTCDISRMKKTGWKALKSVVRWNGELLEIQVQPLDNYYLELDHMAGPSHNSFKLVRDALRRQVAERFPLYGFYRDLLQCIFLDGEIPPTLAEVSLVMTE